MKTNYRDSAEHQSFLAAHRLLAKQGNEGSRQVLETDARLHQEHLFRESAGRAQAKCSESNSH